MVDDGGSGSDGPISKTVMMSMREGSAIGILYSATVARILGISSGDLECLDFVATHQPVTAGALAGTTGLTTGAITGVVDRLEKAGLVRRVRPDSDRRKVLISTTEEFFSRVVPLFEPMQRHQAAAVEAASEGDLAAVAAFMDRSLEAARDALAELAANHSMAVPAPEAGPR